MPKLTFLPHEVICPGGATIDADNGESILDAALRNNISIEHACEKSCACTTCHVIVREGFDELADAEENEEDYLADEPLVLTNEINVNKKNEKIKTEQPLSPSVRKIVSEKKVFYDHSADKKQKKWNLSKQQTLNILNFHRC